jgi:dGTPase
LEVSSVGRSLGEIVGRELRRRYPIRLHISKKLLRLFRLPVWLTIWKPSFWPFGRAGDIHIFFGRKGKSLQAQIEKEGGRWSDFTCFEGNANALRLLIHQFRGRREGGFALTYSTIASIVKYPFSSELSGGKNKFGFFASEESDYSTIAGDLGIATVNEQPLKFARFPLVFLVEAADDICYQVMDIEDAHKLHLVTTEEAIELFLNFFDEPRKKGECRRWLA